MLAITRGNGDFPTGFPDGKKDFLDSLYCTRHACVFCGAEFVARVGATDAINRTLLVDRI